MDDEVRSLSDIPTDSNSDDSSIEDVDLRCETYDGVVKIVESVSEIDEYNDSKVCNPVLDLRNLNEINDYQNDEEKYEKLSEVIEEPEDLHEASIILDQESTLSQSEEKDEKSAALQGRIYSLNNLILSLREELKREVSLWREEREELQILQEKSDLIALDEATAAARAAAEAYAAESPLSEDLNGMHYSCCKILDVNPEQTLSELTILEYEKKLAKYQDALALAQAEKRYNMRRQLAANTYRQKLIEVERLCDEELEKIKQNASSLKPLKQMVSEWYRSDRCGGDGEERLSTPLTHTYKTSSTFSSEKVYSMQSNFRGVSNIENKIDTEVNMAPEIFVAKFNNVDDNDFSLFKGANSMAENLNNRHNILNGVNRDLSLKWESSNYTLSTSLGNP